VLTFSLVSLAIAVTGAMLWKLRLGLMEARRDRGDGGHGEIPRVSVIVPARNEAHNLPALLDSLAALSPPAAQIIVVDDHSTDGTGDLARQRGATVVTPPPLPEGWMGKPWACRAGAAAATGELLLFTDADTVHAPDSLGRAVRHLERETADLLSVIPTHIVRSGWERLQGVFQLLLLIACRAGGEQSAAGERRFSIGQYMLWRRAAYERVGGHDAVSNRVAEDLAFARMVADSGGHYSLLVRQDVMRVRMYPEGFGAFVRGWRRNFREGIKSAGALATLEVVAIIGWLLGAPLLGALSMAAGHGTLAAAWAAMYGLAVVEVARHQRRLGSFPRWSALFYPIFVLVFAAVSALAGADHARRAPVRWRGRAVPQAKTAARGGSA